MTTLEELKTIVLEDEDMDEEETDEIGGDDEMTDDDEDGDEMGSDDSDEE